MGIGEQLVTQPHSAGSRCGRGPEVPGEDRAPGRAGGPAGTDTAVDGLYQRHGKASGELLLSGMHRFPKDPAESGALLPLRDYRMDKAPSAYDGAFFCETRFYTQRDGLVTTARRSIQCTLFY